MYTQLRSGNPWATYPLNKSLYMYIVAVLYVQCIHVHVYLQFISVHACVNCIFYLSGKT